MRFSLLAAGVLSLAALVPCARAEGPSTQPAQRFTITVFSNQMILLDTATGQTWMFQSAAAGKEFWYPIRRLTDPADAGKGADMRNEAREELRRNLQMRGGPGGRQPVDPPDDK